VAAVPHEAQFHKAAVLAVVVAACLAEAAAVVVMPAAVADMVVAEVTAVVADTAAAVAITKASEQTTLGGNSEHCSRRVRFIWNAGRVRGYFKRDPSAVSSPHVAR
jgi:hypothetical protein